MDDLHQPDRSANKPRQRARDRVEARRSRPMATRRADPGAETARHAAFDGETLAHADDSLYTLPHAAEQTSRTDSADAAGATVAHTPSADDGQRDENASATVRHTPADADAAMTRRQRAVDDDAGATRRHLPVFDAEVTAPHDFSHERRMPQPARLYGSAHDAGGYVQPRPAAETGRRARRRGSRRPLPFDLSAAATWGERVRLFARDAWWLVLHRPIVPLGALGVVGVLFLLFAASYWVTGRAFPNVWTMGVALGGLSADDAAAQLNDAWANDLRITLRDGDRTWQLAPLELGMQLDAAATFERARAAGMSGIPFGASVLPVVTLDEFTAQDRLLDLTTDVNYAPYNAGFAWQNGALATVAGRDGRSLDVGMTLETLKTTLATVAAERTLTLVTMTIPPALDDPAPYLAAAQALTAQPFELTGYDPIRDEFMSWSTDPQTLVSWLEVGETGLSLRRDAFAPFIEAQNATLAQIDTTRYLEPTETMDKLEAALAAGAHAVGLRIRYRGTQYEIAPGDTGYRIARKTGIPFQHITTANPGLNWDVLSVGMTINIPPRDLTLPVDPVPHKRIIVNLDQQTLVAYENGQQVFGWAISSGISEFPTYPGVFQVLSHEERALGSSFELCSSSGCAQWEMSWFMGIYEVVPGLMNGFHGAVLLPNGAVLMGASNVGYPYTYGCVMSENSNAEKLFRWADEGTVVEIISSDFAPISPLGQRAVALASADSL